MALFPDESLVFLLRPARTYSNGCKSPNRPDSGKVTAKDKGNSILCRNFRGHDPQPKALMEKLGLTK